MTWKPEPATSWRGGCIPRRRSGVSNTYELTDRAWADFKKLDIWLQEETLDEIEIVAANPSSLKARLQRNAVHDFVRVHGGRQYYVFVTIVSDASAGRFLIKEIG